MKRLGTHCKLGHERTFENTIQSGTKKGQCAICRRLYVSNHYKCNPEKRKLNHEKYPPNDYQTPDTRAVHNKKYSEKEDSKEKARTRDKSKRENLADGYILSLIRMPVSEVPTGFLEAKRLHIQIKRKLKELKNGNNARC